MFSQEEPPEGHLLTWRDANIHFFLLESRGLNSVNAGQEKNCTVSILLIANIFKVWIGWIKCTL